MTPIQTPLGVGCAYVFAMPNFNLNVNYLRIERLLREAADPSVAVM